MSAPWIRLPLVFSLLALAGCQSWTALAAAHASSERHDRLTEAWFELELNVESTQVDGGVGACAGRLELVLTNTRTNALARATVRPGAALHGEVEEGDYELALGVDGMRIGLAQRIGRVHLRKGRQVLGRLNLHLLELAPGTFEAQATEAERLRRAAGLQAVDFVHSPARGLMLMDVRLEGGAR